MIRLRTSPRLVPVELLCKGEGQGDGRVEVASGDGPRGIDHDHKHAGDGGCIPDGAARGDAAADGEDQREGAEELGGVRRVLLDRVRALAQDEVEHNAGQDDGHRRAQGYRRGNLSKLPGAFRVYPGLGGLQGHLAGLEEAYVVEGRVIKVFTKHACGQGAASAGGKEQCEDVRSAVHADPNRTTVRLLSVLHEEAHGPEKKERGESIPNYSNGKHLKKTECLPLTKQILTLAWGPEASTEVPIHNFNLDRAAERSMLLAKATQKHSSHSHQTTQPSRNNAGLIRQSLLSQHLRFGGV